MPSVTPIDFLERISVESIADTLLEVSASENLILLNGLTTTLCREIVEPALVQREMTRGDVTVNGRQTLDLRPKPFNQSNEQALKAFNPFDALPYMRSSTADSLAILLQGLSFTSPRQQVSVVRSFHEPVWGFLADELMHAAAWYLAQRKPSHFTLAKYAEFLLNDDFWAALNGIIVKEGRLIERHIYNVFQTTLKRDDQHKGLIMAYVHQRLADLRLYSYQTVLEKTTLDLAELAQGAPQTIEILIPSGVNPNPANILKLWMTALLHICIGQGNARLTQTTVVVIAPAGGCLAELDSALAQFVICYPSMIDVAWFTDLTVGSGPPAPLPSLKLFDDFADTKPVPRLAPNLSNAAANTFRTQQNEEQKVSHAISASRSEAEALMADSLPIGNLLLFGTKQEEKASFVQSAIHNPDHINVVIDPTGRSYLKAFPSTFDDGHSRSEAFEFPVMRLDPFNILSTEKSSNLNPLDLIKLGKADHLVMAEMLLSATAPSIDAFWRSSAKSLLAAIIQYLSVIPTRPLSLVELRNIFYSDDVIYNLAVVLDTIGKSLPVECYREIAAFLKLPDTTRGMILSHVDKSLHFIGSPEVSDCLADTTIDFDKLEATPNGCIFLCVPLYHASFHAPLIRLWTETLQLALTRTNRKQERRLRFIVDEPEAFGLGNFVKITSLQSIAEHNDCKTTQDIWSFWNSQEEFEYECGCSADTIIQYSSNVWAAFPNKLIPLDQISTVFELGKAIAPRDSRLRFLELAESGKVDPRGAASVNAKKTIPHSETGYRNKVTVVAPSNKSIAERTFKSFDRDKTVVVIADLVGRWFEPSVEWAKSQGIDVTILALR